MAINIPQQVKKRENPTVILGTAIFIVVVVLVVWSQFLRTPSEVKEIPTIVVFETFRRIPQIDFNLLENPALTGKEEPEVPALKIFEEIPPLYCPMETTGGSLESKDDCLAEAQTCFWDEDDAMCYETPGRINPFLPPQ